MTASQRYHVALMRYGDELHLQGKYCDAVKQYEAAAAIAELDADAAKGYNQSFQACYPATETPTPTGVVTTATTPVETGIATTEPAPVTTEPPPPSPTDTPSTPAP